MDSKHKPTYPNTYILLVAEPGTGKSMVTDSVQTLFEMMTDTAAPVNGVDNNINNHKYKLLYPISAESTTFAKFVEFSSRCVQSVDYKENGVRSRYFQCSPCFILDEASSIFDKHADELATFLLSGWGCKNTYIRSTVGRGDDYIKNLCINLIGGLQPGKLKSLCENAIIDNGFARRCIMVYADKPRRKVARIQHTIEQETAYLQLAPHVRALSKLYGQLNVTKEVDDWLDKNFGENSEPPRNKSHFLAHYYSTKIQQVKKLAMAWHFSESLSMDIGVESFIKAKETLDEIEGDMHYAYVGSRDIRGESIKRVKKLLLTAGKEGLLASELYCDLFDLIDQPALNDLLRDLVLAKQIVQTREQTYVIVK